MGTKTRPPHAPYKIKEMIKLGEIYEAQKCCDENVSFYRDKITDMQELYVEAQCAQMGVTRAKAVPHKFAAAPETIEQSNRSRLR